MALHLLLARRPLNESWHGGTGHGNEICWTGALAVLNSISGATWEGTLLFVYALPPDSQSAQARQMETLDRHLLVPGLV